MRVSFDDPATLQQLTSSKLQEVGSLLQHVTRTDADPEAEKVPERYLLIKILETQTTILLGLAAIQFNAARQKANREASSGLTLPNLVVAGRG